MEETSKKKPEEPIEELTTEMHSEFTIGEECARRHKVFALLNFCGGTKDTELIAKWREDYSVTEEELQRYIPEYKARYEV